MLGEVVDDVAGLLPLRMADDERHVEGLGAEALLAELPAVAQHLAVIGGDDDQRSIQRARRRQGIEDPAELPVDLAHQAQIDAADLGHERIGERRRAADLAAHPAAERLVEERLQIGMAGGFCLDVGLPAGLEAVLRGHEWCCRGRPPPRAGAA